ncbi:hypothetical protein N6B72_21915 [Chryseobacterium soli]|uniref:hypothetical protein n=1 Tax=Chryseobacterium soli TaxID=445961 RepID=UPI002953B19C|nr:hypothetical protein [Chryseobacterium soli]MDV7699576.1 hypothetical protein [Chryseobacterium soli]
MDTRKDKILEQFPDHEDQIIPEKDLETYEFLYSALEKSPDTGFSLGFSNKIIRKIEAKQQHKVTVKLYSLASILIAMTLGFSAVFFSKEQCAVLFSMILKYKFAVIFLLAAVSLIQISTRAFSTRELEN